MKDADYIKLGKAVEWGTKNGIRIEYEYKGVRIPINCIDLVEYHQAGKLPGGKPTKV